MCLVLSGIRSSCLPCTEWGQGCLCNTTVLRTFPTHNNHCHFFQEIIHVLTSRLCKGQGQFEHLYAIRMVSSQTGDIRWIHQDTPMHQVQEMASEEGGLASWRFELLIRYLPSDLSDLYEKDKTSFHYYYDQVKAEYLSKNFDSLDLDTAIQLGCLEIRKFFNYMPHVALDKKSNFDHLERDNGLSRFLPQIILANNKPKAIRKLIHQHFKKFAGLAERECMFKFLDILKTIYKFDQEHFRCALGVRWVDFFLSFHFLGNFFLTMACLWRERSFLVIRQFTCVYVHTCNMMFSVFRS